MSTMVEFCEMYDMTIKDLDKMLAVEEIMYPAILEKEKANSDKEA